MRILIISGSQLIGSRFQSYLFLNFSFFVRLSYIPYGNMIINVVGPRMISDVVHQIVVVNTLIISYIALNLRRVLEMELLRRFPVNVLLLRHSGTRGQGNLLSLCVSILSR